jgi:hypothetical protein
MIETKVLHRVGLSKLFLWSEAERIQTYPEAFANIEELRRYTKQQLAKDVFELVYSQHDKSRPIRGDQIRNLFGIEKVSDDKVVIRGINLLDDTDGKDYCATAEALEIGDAYQTNQDGNKWAILLAKQIARYEVRTRLILYLIGIGGWSMVFPSSEFFGQPSSKTILVRDGDQIPIFANNGELFNQLLQEHRHVAIGAWWEKEIEQLGFDVVEEFKFEGVRDGPPSTNKLNSNIKPGLFLMKHLRVMVFQGGGWQLSGEQAVEVFGTAIASDFTDFNISSIKRSPINIMKEAAIELQDHEGFIVVSQLAREWAIQMQIPTYKAAHELDEFIREQMYSGRLNILDRNQGQPRHGRGLFGENHSRKIKLSFSE